ncbi:MAG: hypothetical protein A3J74_06960 [Elusimicrobia bacterium RIFCSPHIGHO2_02_FULL_57_9]|nr:MAG: hypothetical protein A3J74_06960 [Elusimicrobia bacterium RIFCSPHIGHO2_02_FULL_57_9]
MPAVADSLQTLAQDALDWIRRQAGPDLEAEIYLARSEERGVEMRKGYVDVLQEASCEGAGLRIYTEGRMGFASCGGISRQEIEGLFGKAVAQLDYPEPDPSKGFPAPGFGGEDAVLAASLWDESLFCDKLEEIVPRLRDMEAAALGFDKRVRTVPRLGYGESRGEVAIANARGVMTYERGSSASIGLSALCEEKGEIQIGSAMQLERSKALLNFNKTAADASARSVFLLGAKKLPGGRRSVIFDPWMAGEFLDLVAGLLSADQVQRGKSLLAGKLGKKIGSSLATFIDDPRRPGGAGSSLYDDEGLPTFKKVMIEKGVVKEYFYDAATANKDKRKSNASAGRGSYRALPGPSCSNFYLAPGVLPSGKIIESTKDGIMALEIMGMHMADPISGEFSAGVSGIAIKNGRLLGAVKGAMISGNLVELLGRIDAVGNNLTFYGAMGAPTFRISHMTVA